LKMIVLSDFIMFLKNPSIEKQFDIKSLSLFLKLVWKSFFILLAGDLILGFLFCGPLIYFNLFPSLKNINFSLLNILKISLFFPVIEEFIFRLPLRGSKFNFILSFTTLVFLLLIKYLISNVYLAISLALFFCFFFSFIIRTDSFLLIKLINFFSSKFRLIFHFQALLFGFLHLTNYNLEIGYFYIFPLLIMNYIFSGYYLGYLRIRYKKGIYLCVASHIFINTIYCIVFSH
jgi:hypothetical protein